MKTTTFLLHGRAISCHCREVSDQAAHQYRQTRSDKSIIHVEASRLSGEKTDVHCLFHLCGNDAHEFVWNVMFYKKYNIFWFADVLFACSQYSENGWSTTFHIMINTL
jgi:hypothetical protein